MDFPVFTSHHLQRDALSVGCERGRIDALGAAPDDGSLREVARGAGHQPKVGSLPREERERLSVAGERRCGSGRGDGLAVRQRDDAEGAGAFAPSTAAATPSTFVCPACFRLAACWTLSARRRVRGLAASFASAPFTSPSATTAAA